MKNVQRRKLRSWLTIIGIVIGISSLVALISISYGMQKAIEEAFMRMGENKIIVLPGKSSGFLASAYMGKPFTEKDVSKIESLESVESAVGMSYVTLPTYFNKEEFPTIVVGVDVENARLQDAGFEILDGRDFKRNDKNRCRAILGYQYAEKAFDKEIKVGYKIYISNKECRVIGILKPTGSRLDDLAVYVPLNFLQNNFGVKDIGMIICKVRDIDNAKRELEKLLDKIRKEEGYTLYTPEQFAEQMKTILGIISLIVMAVSSISLIVSSIGIMNTMYMAVTERTKEIGLLKALGAKDTEILLLFLLESGIIGLVGGIIGIILGYTFGKVVEVVATSLGYNLFKSYFDPVTTLLIVIFSFTIGIVSGILPARSASKLDPVEALRYE